ncbi:PREDICTED: uncharacterized protein LOC104612578 isoform X2 [Nelumbo nucifera]|uniref:Bromo domain-containing protein n=2 Tax=Nelumbo nucifera TaxID=4432 RepID=A0A822XKL8_NELNU|nr:PREDICTED: uncharacterized protein LOC104612578 isoform X2 [Nelumbo nucifera]DAD20837.1 TPA_asm: hypothetical protein HUJ06_022300 [Nelumbo nucifera]
MMAMMRWSTWEELLLGGAVLRHGTQDWEAVAAELQARILYSCSFTAEICKAKYKDLQERYCGCTWFEELRKQRVAELKRELEKSEDSICSLESKLESLKAEREGRNTDSSSCRTESPATLGTSDGVDFSGKETSSKDGLSAGSFTEETTINWSSQCKGPAPVSAQQADIKPESVEDSDRDKKSNFVDKLEVTTVVAGRGGNLRKRRGKRKRKECSSNISRDVKEGSVAESDVMSSANVIVAVPDKEESTRDCNGSARPTDENDRNDRNGGVGVADLIGIFNSVVENDCASMFRRRLDSQRRSRYKQTVRQHLDFDTIRTRIIDHSIMSSKELFRDLLLLANNAAVFYPKNTRQHKSALALRELAKKTFQRQFLSDSGRETGSSATANTDAALHVVEAPRFNPPVKPRSIRPCNRKVIRKVNDLGKSVPQNPSREGKKSSEAASQVEASAVAKKSVGRPGKVGRRGSRKRPESQAKGRKKARRT